MYARVLTWWTIFRISLEERLVYRGDFALGTVIRFLPIITQIFLWYAVFDAARAAADPSDTQLFGYTYRNVIAYYLLTMITRAFSSMPGLASGTARQIRDGEIKKYLIQPIDMLSVLLLGRIAHKVAYYAVAIVPFVVLFVLCRGYFDGWPEPHVMTAFAASLVMAFLLGFFLEATIGMIAFWFLEVTSLLFVYMLFNFFLSGHMFPLDMLPEPWLSLVDLLPLKYLAYFPAAVFLGKVEGSALAWGIGVQAAWVVFFIFACRWTLHLGMRRYSGYGG